MPLAGEPWSTQAASAAISNILSNCIEEFSAETLWPMPKSEDCDAESVSSIYFGAMGVLWALDHLQQYLDGDLPFNKYSLAEDIHQKYFSGDAKSLKDYADTDGVIPSYWLGESGILLVKSKFQTDKSEEIWQK